MVQRGSNTHRYVNIFFVIALIVFSTTKLNNPESRTMAVFAIVLSVFILLVYASKFKKEWDKKKNAGK